MDKFVVKTPSASWKAKTRSHLPVNITVNYRARNYPEGTFHVDDGMLFCSSCNVVVDYYAVEYPKTYYFGRALGGADGSFINFKFPHSTSSSGAKVFNWPRHDDIDRVHSSCVFYGPVVIVGVGPFTFPQLGEVEQVYQWLRKSRKGS